MVHETNNVIFSKNFFMTENFHTSILSLVKWKSSILQVQSTFWGLKEIPSRILYWIWHYCHTVNHIYIYTEYRSQSESGLDVDNDVLTFKYFTAFKLNITVHMSSCQATEACLTYWLVASNSPPSAKNYQLILVQILNHSIKNKSTLPSLKADMGSVSYTPDTV
jgi:hypothetical protein